MKLSSANRTIDYQFQNYLPHISNSIPEQLFEKSKTYELPYGNAFIHQWHFDGIRISHTQHKFKNHYHFEKKNDGDVVSLEFNIKGRFLIHHHGNTYQVQNQQHNIIYTPV
jgi:hypothetical protein